MLPARKTKKWRYHLSFSVTGITKSFHAYFAIQKKIFVLHRLVTYKTIKKFSTIIRLVSSLLPFFFGGVGTESLS
jgi:hypothetical protein